MQVVLCERDLQTTNALSDLCFVQSQAAQSQDLAVIGHRKTSLLYSRQVTDLARNNILPQGYILFNYADVTVQRCRLRCSTMPTEVFNRSDDGVQFSATALFSLRRRYCSTRAAEVFNLVRYIQIMK